MSKGKPEKKDLLENIGKFFISSEKEDATNEKNKSVDNAASREKFVIPPADVLAPSRLSTEKDDFIA